MYSSGSNGNNPISYPHDQTLPQKPFLIDSNPITKQADIPSSLFSFPSPYPLYDEYPIFLQQFPDLFLQQETPFNDSVIEHEAVISMADSRKNCVDGLEEDCSKKCENESAEHIQSKRSSKKDRHSKINTAHGLRDRRMRLSLEVARKFFDLQDMLGFDKASKTVEWLLMKSNTAIKELGIGTNSGSPVSECEVVSRIDDEVIKKKPSICVVREKKHKVLHRSGFHPIARESREKARERARARARAREKRKLDESTLRLEAINQDLNQLGSWTSPYEEIGNQSHNMNYYSLEGEEMSSQEHLGSTMMITNNWNPSIVFNYQNNTATSQEHQSTDIQFYGKPWEA